MIKGQTTQNLHEFPFKVKSFYWDFWWKSIEISDYPDYDRLHWSEMHWN